MACVHNHRRCRFSFRREHPFRLQLGGDPDFQHFLHRLQHMKANRSNIGNWTDRAFHQHRYPPEEYSGGVR